MSFDVKKLTPAAVNVAATAGGAIAAGMLRKKFSFFDNALGKVLLIAAGIYIVSQSKSDLLKGIGTGVAMNGALGFATGLLGFDGLNGAGTGTVVQDENGMVYLMNGTGEILPYEIPVVEGVGEAISGEEEIISGISGKSELLALS